jgi:ABC-2 type transport system ATP-binding protein
MNAVEIEHVTKIFGEHVAVDGLSLVVPAGSIYGFIGPNGSGKTTTLRMLLRIFYPDRGVIRVLGDAASPTANDRVGYLPEERGLYRRMKVKDVLRFAAALKGMRDPRKAIDTWLERLGLADWADKKVEALSKGMAQKVQFVASVVTRPELILLDEPFSGLDPVNAEALREAVLDLRRSGSTVIFSTHDMTVAEKMCDFIFMIYQGRKVLDGTLASIRESYGQNTVRVRLEGNVSLADLPGVCRVVDFGQQQELVLDRGADSQRVLAAVMARGRIAQFELAHPSLHDIFVRIASPRAPDGTTSLSGGPSGSSVGPSGSAERPSGSS